VSAKHNLPSGLVTFLFTDIEGSTRLAQLLGGEYRSMLAQHRRILRRALTDAGGVFLFAEGDSVFAAFPDAIAAVEACATAQRALVDYKWPDPNTRPRVRMGLHSGFAEPMSGEYATAEVHRAARVASAAHGGQVLCSGATAHLASDLDGGLSLLDLGLFQLRGFDGRERLYQLVGTGLDREFPRPRTLAAASHNLPAPPSPFVGRRHEQAELARLIDSYRVLTLVGPGGAGKTRLALEVARTCIDSFPDGVWFVDLATVSDPVLVAVSVAEVLGVRPEPGRPILDTLAESAGARKLLLVLDTCDAQPAAANQLASRLLTAGSGIRVLATSRESLSVPGEMVWRIPPMALTGSNGDGPPDAVALLVARAEAARGGRAPTEGEMPHLHRVAQRLDGLPLALELAAVRLRLFSAAQLADRLDDLLGTLDAGGPKTAEYPIVGKHRHSTLRATVDWSYRTLPADAAALLRQLCVFAGPLGLETIEWVGGPGAVDRLAVLVAKSLVVADPGGGPEDLTYRILDPIKAFGVRAVLAAGEEASARDKHLAWALHAIERIHTDADGKPLTLTTYPLDRLAGEARASLTWSVAAGRVRLGLRLAVLLDEWWRERGLPREARLWFYRLFEKFTTTTEEIPSAELAVAYHAYARHAGADGEYGEQLRLLVQAEETAWRSGRPALIARVSACRGEALVALGREDEAERACRDVIEWARTRHVEAEALPAVFTLAQLLWRRGRLAEAATELGAARASASTHPTERGRRSVDMLLGLVALSRGDLIAAHDHIVVALRFRMTHGYHWAACEALTAMAVRCVLGGEMTQAATLFGAAQAAREALCSRQGAIGPMGQRHEAVARNTMGDGAFDTAYAAGAAMSLPEATQYALAVEHPDYAHGLVSIDTDPTTDLSLPAL
jgi:predicted ATPase/class 3 adenylate cyclase